MTEMRLRDPDQIEIYLEGNEKGGRIDRAGWVFKDAEIKFGIGEDMMKVFLKSNVSEPRFIKLRWVFSASEMRQEPVRVMDEAWERGYGRLQWHGIEPENTTPWAFAVSNGSDSAPDVSERRTECFGVKVRPNAMCLWQYDQKGVTLWADVRCGGVGVRLAGREITVCEVLFREYCNMSAFSAVNAFYSLLCDDPLVPKEKIYGSNNWYYAYGHFTQEDIVNDAKLISGLCEGLTNRPFMVIDDGWENPVRSCPLKSRPTCPDMRQLADEIRRAGAKPGIWIRYLIDREYGLFPAGSEQRMTRDGTYLDPSHPDVLKVIAKQTDQIVNEWGYRLIKHDFSTFDIFGYWGSQTRDFLTKDRWTFFDRSKTTAEIIKNLYAVILEAAKGNAVILGCNVIGHLAAGYVHANRTGDDTSGMEWERTRFMGVNTLAFRMVHNGNFYAADPDCVGATELVPWKLNREWLKAVGSSGTTLFISCKPGIFTEAEYGDMKQALARNSLQNDTLVPVDWMETTCPRRWLLNGEPVTYDWLPDEGAVSIKTE